MNKLYASPLRVYLLLGALALCGLYSGLTLPVSLFPNSSKPIISVRISYGSMTTEEFLNSYGKALEEQLRIVTAEQSEVEKVDAFYYSSMSRYSVYFKWGTVPDKARQAVENTVNSFAARFPEEVRDSVGVWQYNENSGFFAATFFSDVKSLDELYEILEPVLLPKLSSVKDALGVELWNPSRKDIQIELMPDVLASLQLFPRDIEQVVTVALKGRRGGSFEIGPKQLSVEMPRLATEVDDLKKIVLQTPSKKMVHLSDVARINFGPMTSRTNLIKTSGTPSLILDATPKPGGNVKKMSEEILRVISDTMPSLPKDIQYKVLVDPSEFIRSAISNVSHEVAIGAFLAVCVLFLFIGSLRNVITAAIEIPMSIVLAFILMKVFNINLNLISLGGLALSAGMNVDASVVVMENIFRHFEKAEGKLTYLERLKITTDAVGEVRFAVIASTISSLVVFIPLTFTSDLSYAILGDLAKAVVFSHGLSAIVALILVPTVRLQLMSYEASKGRSLHIHSPIESWLKKLENGYAKALTFFVGSSKLKWGAYSGIVAVLVLLAGLILPKLPKEVIGIPDTDWIVVGIGTEGNSIVRQMELQSDEIEREILREFGSKIQYTFTQIGQPNRAQLMARLRNKRDMNDLWRALEAKYTNTPQMNFYIAPWNPSELPLPRTNHMEISVNGGVFPERALAVQEVVELFEKNKLFPNIWETPSVKKQDAVYLEPNQEQWSALEAEGARFSYFDLTDMVRVATSGRTIGEFPVNGRLVNIRMQFPEKSIKSVEDIASLPIGVGSKVVPLKALQMVTLKEAPPNYFRENGRDRLQINARHKKGDEWKAKESVEKAKKLVAEWVVSAKERLGGKELLQTMIFEDPEKDLNEALKQLGVAVGLSILLIFMTMVFQFGSVIEAILVLVAVPLGFIGVLLSLFVFGSTLSLNSILGVILLNGIAVANSILLVDFMKRLVKSGLSPVEAAVEAARKRLRPILITSLTTVLGMMPIALGMGEGGRILQPLGIAVSGGLWFSMTLTLFIVPALQVSYLNWKMRRRESKGGGGCVLVLTCLVIGVSFLVTIPAKAVIEDDGLSVETMLKLVVDRHLDVKAARERLEAAQARNISSRYIHWPSLSLEAREELDKSYRDASTGKAERVEGVSAALKMNLYQFGLNKARFDAASKEEEKLSFEVEKSELFAESEGAKAIFAVIETELTSSVIKRIADMMKEASQLAEERMKKGLLARQEWERVMIDQNHAELKLKDAELEAEKAQITLRKLLNEKETPTDNQKGFGNGLGEWPWKKRALGKEQILLKARGEEVSVHPEIQAASKAVVEKELQVKQSWASMMPSLDAVVNYGYSRYPDDDSTMRKDGADLSTALVFSVPLFDRMSDYSNYRANAVGKKLAETELERVRRDLLENFEKAKATFKYALNTAQERDKTHGMALGLYRDNLSRFQKGLVTANELMVDQDRLLNAELLSINGWGQVHESLVELCHTLGKRIQRCLEPHQ